MSHSPSALVAGLVILALAQWSEAQLKDQVLALTGNARAKAVWLRAPSSSNSDDSHFLYNTDANTSLMIFDSDEGAERVLDANPSQHCYPLITRSGDYVIWNEYASAKSWIIKADGTEKKILIGSGNYYVLSSQWDQVARKEYLYICNPIYSGYSEVYPEPNAAYRVELKNGAVDTTQKTVAWQSSTRFRMPFLVSADGKYAACNLPWPEISVLTLGTTSKAAVNTNGDWACWPNMAPDLSYRMFHLNDAHTMLYLYSAPYSQRTTIQVSPSLPGNTQSWDICAPRFSNHQRFLSVSYPLTPNTTTGRFCIGKFNDANTAISWVRLSVGDQYRERVGDFWVASGEGPNRISVNSQSERPTVGRSEAGVRLSVDSRTLRVTGPVGFSTHLLDATGRVRGVFHAGDRSEINIDMRSLGSPVIVADIRTRGVSVCKKVLPMDR